jgi:hypothetical protein
MFRSICVTAALVGASVIGGEPSTVKAKQDRGFASPREAWDAYRHARHEGRWRDAFRCLTPQRKVEEIEWCLLYADFPVGKMAKVQAIMRRFALDIRQIQRELVDMQAMGATDGERIKYADGLVSQVKDKETLYDELMKEVCKGLPTPPVVALGELKSLEITGDRARGEYIERLDDSEVFIVSGVRQTEVRTSEGFRKIGGGWFLAAGRIKGEGDSGGREPGNR